MLVILNLGYKCVKEVIVGLDKVFRAMNRV